MLKLSCVLFLRRATAGTQSRHRRRCRDCDAYLEAIESLGRVGHPLSPGLEERLHGIPDAAPLIPRLPTTPLPRALRRRLSGILPAARPAVPRFVGSPVYAVAVSSVLVLLLAGLWGNPYKIVQPTFMNVHSSATAALAETGSAVSAWVHQARTEIGLQGHRAEAIGDRLLFELEAALASLTEKEEEHADS